MKAEKVVRVVIYIRVSTQEQAKEGYSIDAQKEKLINYCKARGWTIVEIIVDPGYSGSSLDRPGIQQLISHVNQYDVVLVYKLDRLSRSQRDTLYLIEDIFLPNGVDFVSMSESFDTSSPFGRAVIGILSVFAQLERETIKERMDMGRVERVKEGKYHGGSPPIGYDYSTETGKLVVNEYEAMQVKMIYDLYIGTAENPGMGARKIAQYMTEKGYSTKYGNYKGQGIINDILTNRNYLGEIRFRDIVVKDAHEAIISQEQFDRAQFIRKTRDDVYKGATRSTQLLTGFLWCGVCGARCTSILKDKHKGDYPRRYICYSRLKTNDYMKRADNCTSTIWSVPDLDAVVDYEIRSLIFDRDYLRRLIKRDELERPAQDDHDAVVMKQVEAVEKKIERLMDLYADGTLPVDLLNDRIKKLYAEKETLLGALSDTEPTPDGQLTELETREYLDDIGPIWDRADVAQKREILSVLINRVLIFEDNTVKIEWAFN